ncbi:MAG: hypothetical protein C0498_13985 [Anaerolinea sp.]|jgi:mycothiol synthase|nr:hypothetical protein [Anaerolinea sp.]
MTVEPATSIPGLSVRPFDPGRDYGRIAELLRVTNLHDGTEWLPSEEVLRDEWQPTARFEPSTDVIVAEVGRRAVGVADTAWRIRGDGVTHEVKPLVHPELRGRGLGRLLLTRIEDRARAAAREAERVDPGLAHRPHHLTVFAEDQVLAAADLATSAGYARHTYGFLMRRPLATPIEPASLPPGVDVRPVRPEDHRAIWDADTEAFLDHAEPAVRDEEDFVRWFGQPAIDTSLWRVAWAGDDVAGSVMTFVWADENERLGVRRAWLEHISVRRPWRGRGLARALISDTLRMLADAGFEEAVLGVHGENPTGAVGLYERCGFEVHRRWTVWRKPLQASRG